MGVDFYCCEKYSHMSYSTWNNMRTTAIMATKKYLKKQVDTENMLLDKDKIHHSPLLSYFIEMEEKSLDNFINITNNLDFVDDLIYFDVGGLFALCNKSDCDGFYSPGNSLDICKLFELIEPYVKEIDENIHDMIYIYNNHMNNDEYQDIEERICKENDFCNIFDLFKMSFKRQVNIMIL